MLNGKKILLIISGGIAAYKSLELIRLYKKAGANVKCILTNGGAHFVTPLSVAALTEEQIYTDQWSLKDETEMGHIRLSREADVIVIAPASANLIAQVTYGLADDLASTTLLAADKDILMAPAMNPMMWANKSTQENIKTLTSRGIHMIGPCDGLMACGETGSGRMSEPQDILQSTLDYFQSNKPLAGLKALVTSGPTYEAIDPVRFIGNRSSGKQGHALATALSNMGADVTLISGPTALNDPDGLKTIHIQSAAEMMAACIDNIPVDIAICAAAVSDWTPKSICDKKIKKEQGKAPPALELTETPDILKTISNHAKRPQLVIGFAAETNDVLDNAQSKLTRKGCDWIIANSVAGGETFGADDNAVTIIQKNHTLTLNRADKNTIARDIVKQIIEYINQDKTQLKAAE